jgi:putative FmdB family regulatory protein
MPIFEFECPKCQETTTVLMICSDDQPPECPKCNCEMKKVMSAPAIAKLATPAYGVM